MIQIEVMYVDKVPATGKYRQHRVDISEARAVLDKTGVLFMILSAPTTPAMSRRLIDGVHYRRASESFGGDNYGLLFNDGEGGPNWLLWPWDDGEFTWTSVADPLGDKVVADPLRQPHWDDKINYPPWTPPTTILFRGGTILMPDWEIAEAQFNAEMH